MKVEFKQWHDVLGLATKQIGKPSVYINNGLEYNTPEDETIWFFIQSELASLYGVDAKTCTYRECPEFFDIRSNLIQGGLFFFESEEEQYKFYKIFEQPLTDSSAVYACTFNKNGECETENT